MDKYTFFAVFLISVDVLFGQSVPVLVRHEPFLMYM